MHDPVAGHSVDHLPIACDLPEGGVEWVIAGRDGDRFLGTSRPVFGVDGGARFSHHRLSPEIVDLEHEVGVVVVGRFFEHVVVSGCGLLAAGYWLTANT